MASDGGRLGIGWDEARARAARGEWGEARDLLLGVSPADLDPEQQLLLAESHLRTGHLAAAHDLLGPMVAALEEDAADATSLRAINMLGAALFELGRLADAEPCFRRALAVASRVGDALTIGRATNNLGMIAHIRAAFEEALSLYKLAVPAYQRIGFVAGLAETHHNMALAHRELGQLDDADRQERRAIAFAGESGNGRLLAIAQVGRAELALRRGEPVVAEAGARLGAAAYAAIPDAVGEADALRLAGAARTELPERRGAREALDRAIALAREHGSTLIEAEALEARARLHAREGRPAETRADVETAAARYRGLGAALALEELERWFAGLEPR